MRQPGGFTLLELLVVIAIIGIIAAVLLPNLLNARNSAVMRAADNYARNVYMVAHAHLAGSIHNTLESQSCVGSYEVGVYRVSAPTTIVASCEVTITEQLTPIVTYQANVAGAPEKTIPPQD